MCSFFSDHINVDVSVESTLHSAKNKRIDTPLKLILKLCKRKISISGIPEVQEKEEEKNKCYLLSIVRTTVSIQNKCNDLLFLSYFTTFINNILFPNETKITYVDVDKKS